MASSDYRWTGNGPTNDYHSLVNWTGPFYGPDADDRAIFPYGAAQTVVLIDAPVFVGSWEVTGDGIHSGPFYAFVIAAATPVVFSSGLSGTAETMTLFNNGSISFFSPGYQASASGATFEGSGIVEFNDNSTAWRAQFDMSGGSVIFRDESTAADSYFDLDGTTSVVEFRNTSTAASSRIDHAGITRFVDQASAGRALIFSNGDVQFLDQASAGTSLIRYFKELRFQGSSTAASAQLDGDWNPSSTIVFAYTSDAGNARIDGKGVTFGGQSSAAAALLFVEVITFNGNATGGSATITVDAATFDGHSSAQNATIKTASIALKGNATAGSARLTIAQTADFSATAGLNGDHRITADSFNGAGNLLLGTNELTLGAAGGSSAISGSINGTGGSLVKAGTGRLVLSGAVDQSGGTRVDGGIVQLDGAAQGNITVSNGGRLAGSGQIIGTLMAQAGGVLGPGLADTGQEGFGTLSVTGSVKANAGSTFLIQLGGPSGTEHDTLVLGNRLLSISYTGGTGNDVVLTNEGVLVAGSAGRETVSATKAPAGQPLDTLLADKIIGMGGNDKLLGDAGTDTIQGGTGDDQIDGGKGSDTADYSDKTKAVVVTLDGSHEVRVKVKGRAEDTLTSVENLIGGSKADTFTGDRKANSFEGGHGKDILKGNGGKDAFVFSVAPGKANADTILDFKHKTDSIALDDKVFAALGVTLDAAEFHARKGASKAHDADDRIIYDKSSGKLYYDADGSDGPARAMLFATLSNKAALTVGDFDIV
jgi:autotransporter-associated beta strand protein